MSTAAPLELVLKSVMKAVLTKVHADMNVMKGHILQEIAVGPQPLPPGYGLPEGLIGTNGIVDETAVEAWVDGMMTSLIGENGLIGTNGTNTLIGENGLTNIDLGNTALNDGTLNVATK